MDRTDLEEVDTVKRCDRIRSTASKVAESQGWVLMAVLASLIAAGDACCKGEAEQEDTLVELGIITHLLYYSAMFPINQ